ncbi:hypothetical protein HYALB_00003025 [Hymenoscyphus albidus]|uniref:Peptidase S53 domain-containing protein n=1 Tax=Hymenoscyphus albidus TaxID=595503 RepID=A0A9N9LZV2_9HELO|nr:hypothetical protein HYALB_00003025 [Hymenoscyphus albidus]
MFFSRGSLLGAFVLSVAAVPFPGTHNVHEKRDVTSHVWIKRDRLDASAKIPVRIGMTQRNLEKGHNLLMEVSSPDSAKYGKHHTAEEVADIFAPHKTTTAAIISWLVESGIPVASISQSANKQWMQFDAATSELESLLKTEYHVYEHAENGKSTIACDQYHVPAHIQEHIDYITPGIKLHIPMRKRSKGSVDKRTFGVTGGKNRVVHPPDFRPMPDFMAQAPTGCDTMITPECIKVTDVAYLPVLYNITEPTLADSGNAMGIFEDLGDVYSQADLNSFWAKYAKNILRGTAPTLNAIDGAVAPVSTDDPPTENDYQYNGFLNNFLYALDGSYCLETQDPLDPQYPNPSNQAGAYKGALQCGVYKPTNVISISYGGDEIDLPVAYQRRQCAEFMKLGLQGVSIVISSGDSGVEGRNCLGSSGKVFSPDFPASCPYLTAVGSTFLPKGANVATDAEVATSRFPSGGGFSNLYQIPSYQATAVSNYLTRFKPTYKSYTTVNLTNIGASGGLYNSAGRAYPDVEAIGDNIVIFSNGREGLIGGTSASAPAFGAILTRINEERLAAGKSTVGFVNPTLYSNPGVLHDITTGTNEGCGTSGFSASAGWDPVTGLGTPNYPAMLELFMGLA